MAALQHRPMQTTARSMRELVRHVTDGSLDLNPMPGSLAEEAEVYTLTFEG